MFVGFIFFAMYCVAVAVLEMLGTTTTGMAIDDYSPICDNAGCIAEMAAMSHGIRERTNVVDAAGNTTTGVTGKTYESNCLFTRRILALSEIPKVCKSTGIEESMEQLMSTKTRHRRVVI
nr:pyrophosphatase [Tanacetum cinerariifolium]